MLTAIRIVGGLLVLLGAANLVGLFVIDPAVLKSPAAVFARHLLMIAAGTGFLLARRWAVYVYVASLLINWITFLTVYDARSFGPIWLTLPIPAAILILSGLAWGKLKPGRGREAAG